MNENEKGMVDLYNQEMRELQANQKQIEEMARVFIKASCKGSECGISIEDYSEKEVDEENGDITYREYMFKYCPNCGAKVVKL